MKKIVDYFKDIDFWIILLFFYFSIESLLFGTNANSKATYFHYCIVFIIGLLFFIKTIRNKKILKQDLLILLCLIVLVLLTGMIKDTYIFKDNNIFKYIYEIFLFIISFCYVYMKKIEIFLEKFFKVIIWLSMISWIPYLTNLFFPAIIRYFPIIRNTANWRFYNMFIGVAPINEYYHTIFRNYSIFREPGVFAIFLLLGIIILFFYKNKDKNFIRYFIILSLTIISTFSTAGVLCLAIVLFFYFFSSSNKFNFNKIIISFGIVFGILFLGNSQYKDLLFNKITGSNQSSLISRTNSIKANIVILLDNNLLLGTGWGNSMIQFERVSSNLIDNSRYKDTTYHNTNTLFRLLSTHGVLFFSIICAGLIKFFNKLTGEKSYNSFLLFLIFSLMLFSENISLNLIFYIIVFYGLLNTNVKKDKNIKKGIINNT